MIYSRKLKPDRDITGLLPAIFAVVVSGLTLVTFGPEEAIRVLGAIAFIYALFAFIAVYRTRNVGYMASSAYILFMSIYLGAVKIEPFRRNVLVQTPLSKLFLLFMVLTKKVKWRGREILELAALDIDEGSDTYTDRPRPVTKLEYTRDEIENFVEYLKRNLVVMPYYEMERILLVPVKMGDEFSHLFSSNINYWNKTWIAFDFDGNISSHISKKDYLDYKMNLDFDGLCESLGKLFVELFEYMRKGEEVRIIDKLNEVKVGYFS